MVNSLSIKSALPSYSINETNLFESINVVAPPIGAFFKHIKNLIFSSNWGTSSNSVYEVSVCNGCAFLEVLYFICSAGSYDISINVFSVGFPVCKSSPAPIILPIDFTKFCR